jgi:hypothetical protein
MNKRYAEERVEKLLADFTESLAGEASGPMALSSEETNPLSEETDDILPLLKTIRTISRVIQSEQPSEEFIARVSHIVQERIQEQIPIEKTQRIIAIAAASLS